MAMNGVTLGDAIVDTLISLNPHITGAHEARLRTYWHAVATDIVAHIQNLADVLPAAHAGTPLTNNSGQPVVIPVTANAGSESDGTTATPQEIIGKGSIV